MLTMQDLKDLDDCLGCYRGNKKAQMQQMNYEATHNLEPVYSAYMRYVHEFNLSGTLFDDVFEHIFKSINFLAAGGQLASNNHYFSWANGKQTKGFIGKNARISINGQPVAYASDVTYSENQSDGPCPCDPKDRVPMIFSSYCKKCNKTH